ncbi:ATP-binding cassette sub-family C member 3-like isoform X2 [Argiope bruennichi]|nr:ATP-binding cassette sub-family C member 3-like isoform X2 [Argiope bruennichi]
MSGQLQVRNGHTPWTKFTISKLVLTSVLIVCGLEECVYLLSEHSSLQPVLVAKVYYSSLIVRTLTFMLALYLQYKQHKERKPNSNALSTFWLLFFICNLFNSPVISAFGIKLEEMEDPVTYTLTMITLVALTAQTLLSFFTDPPSSCSWHPQKDEFLIEEQTLISRLLFSWMTKIVWHGYRNTFDINNLAILGRKMQAMYAYSRFQKPWSKKQKSHRISSEADNKFIRRKIIFFRRLFLLLAIYKGVWHWILLTGFIELICTVLYILPIILIDYIIQYSESNEPAWHGYMYVASIFVVSILHTLLSVHNTNLAQNASFFLRPALSSAVYRKCLRLSNRQKHLIEFTKITDLATVEAPQASEWLADTHKMWSIPLRIILLIFLLIYNVESSLEFEFLVLTLIVYVIAYIEKKSQRQQVIQEELRALRIKQMSDVLENIKTIKLCRWEAPFMKEINRVRQEEASVLRIIGLFGGLIFSIQNFLYFALVIIYFLNYAVFGEEVLNPGAGFGILIVCNLLASSAYTNGILSEKFSQGRESFIRVIDFLLGEQIDESVLDDEADIGNAIEIENGTFQWDKESDPTLHEISISVPPGCLAAVVGPAEAGKSALFSAIIGDMHSSAEGVVRRMKGKRLAYVAEDPWTPNTTIRKEILFGRTMDEEKYEAILKLCGLHLDLQSFPDGDLTNIGILANRLTEEQLQRVCLARALYQDADIYLLDDPFHLFNSEDREQLFHQVLGPNGFLKERTRIHSTHDHSLLPEFDKIFFMSEGRIIETGSFQELITKNGDFAKWMKENQDNPETTRNEVLNAYLRINASSEEVDVKEDYDDEKVEINGVKLRNVRTYFLYGSLRGSLLFFLVFVAYLSLDIGSSVWLIQWSKDVGEKPYKEWYYSRKVIYGCLQFGQCFILITVFGFGSFMAKRFAVNFHKSMLRSVLRAPMSFFNTTSLNTIVKRFRDDLKIVDDHMPNVLLMTFMLMVGIFGSSIVITAIHPFFLIVLTALCILCFFLIRFYMTCKRRFQALHNQTYHRVYQSSIDSLVAGMTIRTHRCQDEFARFHDEVTDSNSRVILASEQLDRWFDIRLQFLANVVVFATALLSVAYKSSLSPAHVGLTMFYAISLSNKLVSLIPIVVAVTEETMASLHRIREYSNITPEDSSVKERDPFCPIDWLDRGHVAFQDYSVKRKQGDGYLLQGINIEFLPGEKVAIVGGKESGKDLLAYGLFRTVEPESGKIFIDGIDITMIGLQELRSKIAFIPKNPVMLDGSIRFNLDPLEEYSDSDLWKAIERAHLKDYVTSLEGRLDFLILKEEEGLSDGRKQQLSLARALLKDSKILVWNEDPSPKYMEEDDLIRNIIMNELPACTVITVCHRLYTIQNYDRVLVMEDGKIVEEGRPVALFSNELSPFYKLCKAMAMV